MLVRTLNPNKWESRQNISLLKCFMAIHAILAAALAEPLPRPRIPRHADNVPGDVHGVVVVTRQALLLAGRRATVRTDISVQLPFPAAVPLKQQRIAID